MCAKKFLLVGDPDQLSPVILSRTAKRFGVYLMVTRFHLEVEALSFLGRDRNACRELNPCQSKQDCPVENTIAHSRDGRMFVQAIASRRFRLVQPHCFKSPVSNEL